MAGIEPFTSRSEKLAGPILNLMVSTPTISGSDYNISKFQLKQNARTLCSPCFHTYGIDIQNRTRNLVPVKIDYGFARSQANPLRQNGLRLSHGGGNDVENPFILQYMLFFEFFCILSNIYYLYIFNVRIGCAQVAHSIFLYIFHNNIFCSILASLWMPFFILKS